MADKLLNVVRVEDKLLKGIRLEGVRVEEITTIHTIIFASQKKKFPCSHSAEPLPPVLLQAFHLHKHTSIKFPFNSIHPSQISKHTFIPYVRLKCLYRLYFDCMAILWVLYMCVVRERCSGCGWVGVRTIWFWE